MALPLGLCPPVLIWLMFKYLQMADTAPVTEESLGALSDLSDNGTPR
jgi:hypothetical protein